MARLLKALVLIVGVTAMLVLGSLFVRTGDHDDSRAIRELLAIPVPPWCVTEMERFSDEWLRDSQSRLVHVGQGVSPFPYVGAVLLIRPLGESVDIPRLAFEEHHHHCAIREEFRFVSPGALEQATRVMQSGGNDDKRYFVIEVHGPADVVRVIPLSTVP